MVTAGLALLGGPKTVTTSAPAWPIVGEQEVAWMTEVVRSGRWSWLGEHETAFCEEFARFTGATHALCLANGTVTLQCALQAVGVQPGHEVIVPGLTWVATMQAALDVGADVVLVDIDPETWCIDPQAVEAAITPRTKAIVPVHLYGSMCDMDALLDIARRHNLAVVEDAAHQHGSQWRGRAAGAIGDVGSFSFQQSKVLTCGEGGGIVCSDDAIYEAIFAMKHVGWKPDFSPSNGYGHNYRVTEMQCVLLRAGLRRLPEHLQIREEAAASLRGKLASVGGPLQPAPRDPRVTMQSYYALQFNFDPEGAEGVTREQYAQALEAEGLPLMEPYWPVYAAPLLNLYHPTSPIPYRDQSRIQDFRTLKLPVTERVCRTTGLLLSHQWLLQSEPASLGQIVEAIAKVNANLGAIRQHFTK